MLTQPSLTDPRLREILAAEPRLQPLLDQANQVVPDPRYDRIRTFDHLRLGITPLVGWHAEHPDLRNSGDFQLVLEILINLIPPDHLDQRYPPPRPYRR